MKFETLIKFLMVWQGSGRPQAEHYIKLRDEGHTHAEALWTAFRKTTDDFSLGTWNVTVEESQRFSENLS